MRFQSKEFFSYTFTWVMLFFCLSGALVSVSRKNFLLVWFGFELNLFRTIPLLLKENSHSAKNKILVYFIVQVVGSILFVWGSMIIGISLFCVLGVLLKLGVFPFFFWVSPLITDLKWFSIFVILVLKKIPGFFILRHTLDLDSFWVFWCCFFTLVVSTIYLYNQVTSLKSLLAWSSINKRGLLVLLCSSSFLVFIVYFVVYRLLVSLICFFFRFEKKEGNYLGSYFFSKQSLFYVGLLVFFFFVGLPPFLVFIYKVLFFYHLVRIKLNLLFLMLMVGLIYLNSILYFWIVTNHLLLFIKNARRYSLRLLRYPVFFVVLGTVIPILIWFLI